MGPPLRYCGFGVRRRVATAAAEHNSPRTRARKPLIAVSTRNILAALNFASDVVDSAPASRLALIALARDGSRSEISFGEVSERSARVAGALLERGVVRGDVVMTLIGNRPEWVYAMVACFRIGAVVLPSTEQLRPGDLRARFDRVEPRLVVADRRNLETVAESGFSGPVVTVPDDDLVGRGLFVYWPFGQHWGLIR